MADFGEIVDGTFVLSPEQGRSSADIFSDIKVSGIPTIYHARDVVNLPYTTGETSTIEAIGLAWSAFSSGIGPA